MEESSSASAMNIVSEVPKDLSTSAPITWFHIAHFFVHNRNTYPSCLKLLRIHVCERERRWRIWWFFRIRWWRNRKDKVCKWFVKLWIYSLIAFVSMYPIQTFLCSQIPSIPQLTFSSCNICLEELQFFPSGIRKSNTRNYYGNLSSNVAKKWQYFWKRVKETKASRPSHPKSY